MTYFMEIKKFLIGSQNQLSLSKWSRVWGILRINIKLPKNKTKAEMMAASMLALPECWRNTAGSTQHTMLKNGQEDDHGADDL